MADADFTHRESTAWVSGTSTLLPTYPADVADGGVAAHDIVYMTIHVKPDTTTIAPSGSWTLVEEHTGGSGAVGGGTGATKVGVWKRSVPGGGLTTTTTVTLTGASVGMGCMSSYRPVVAAATTWTEDMVSASLTSSSTDLAATASAAPSIAIADGRHVAVVVGAPDDQSTTQPVSTIVASGATIGTPAVAPGDDFSSTGNDIATSRYNAEVTAGSSSAAPSITGTAASSETRIVVWMVIRAEQSSDTTGTFAGTAPEASGALTGSETITGATAGTAPEASGALTGTETITGAFAGTAPEAAGSLTGDVEGVVGGTFAGTAPEASGALTGSETISGAFAASSPAAVGALVAGEESAAPTLPLRVGAPSKPPGLRAGTPTKDAGLSVGTPS